MRKLPKILGALMAFVGLMSPQSIQASNVKNVTVVNQPGQDKLDDEKPSHETRAEQNKRLRSRINSHRTRISHDGQRQQRKHRRSNPNARNRYGLKTK